MQTLLCLRTKCNSLNDFSRNTACAQIKKENVCYTSNLSFSKKGLGNDFGLCAAKKNKEEKDFCGLQ